MSELIVPSHEIAFTDQQKDWILDEIRKTLDTGSVVLGPNTEKFEAAYAERCGRTRAVAMASDTAAFEALLRIIGVEGETVLYPALGFPSLMQSVKNAGGQAWFVDASIEHGLFATGAMIEKSILEVQESTGKPPKALILMHTGGLLASDSEEIEHVCRDYDVVLFEDAAHAYGASHKGRAAGTFGVASAFSLYATKPMHTCEGGIIVTDSEEIEQRAKSMRNYGRMSNFGRSIVTEHGYSWRMTEMQAIIGLSNLTVIDQNIAERRAIMETYDEYIAMTSSFQEFALPLQIPSGMDPNGYRYLCMLPETWGAEQRTRMKQICRERHGIDLPGEVYELPTHKQPIWIDQYADVSMPVAEDFCNRHFALPVYPTLPQKMMPEDIVDAVASALAETDKEMRNG